jgi:type VI secretion system protein ImpB
MADNSAQKDFRQEAFVHITYDVERGNSDTKREIPFVMGVLADLAGKNNGALAPVPERRVDEINGETFPKFMRSIKPQASFRVDSTFKEGEQLSVSLSFEKMEDFSPAGVARQVPQLAFLLEQRTKLKNLLAYMDGKANAETWLSAKLDLESHPELKALVDADRKSSGEPTTGEAAGKEK